MSTPNSPAAEPFFEPLPEPEPVTEQPRAYPQLPWDRPLNVVPVQASVSVELARTDDTVVRLYGFDVYPSGVAYEVRVWLRPGTERSSEPGNYDPWSESPRVGWLLEDGTKIGARAPSPYLDETTSDAAFHITGIGGESGDLRAAYGHWLYPVPPGERWVAVVEWQARGIPETRVEVDARPIHEAAAASAGELWELPPAPADAEYGWFAYAPMTGSTHGSRSTTSHPGDGGTEGTEDARGAETDQP